MSVASVGTGFVTPLELFQDKGSAQKAHILAAQQHTEVVKQAAATLPKNRGEPKSHALHLVAADLEQVSLAFNKKLQFVVDHRSNEVIVKVIDRETDKVIKELPPEELQHLHSRLKETIGFLFAERV